MSPRRRVRIRLRVQTRGITPAIRRLTYAQKTLNRNMAAGVLAGARVIQQKQRRQAPHGRSGSIPRSIEVSQRRGVGRNTFAAVSQSRYDLAFWHETGTGTHGPYEAPYTLYWRMPDGSRKPGGRPVHGGADYSFEGGRPIKHPGVRGRRFFERGFETGEEQAVNALERSIGRSFVR